jgi:hypothetical protein
MVLGSSSVGKSLLCKFIDILPPTMLCQPMNSCWDMVDPDQFPDMGEGGKLKIASEDQCTIWPVKIGLLKDSRLCH